jgi:hypothetical protein
MQLLALMAMNALGVYAPGDVGRCCIGLAVNIDPLVLPIGVPSLFDGLCRFGGINVEPNDGQEHGANADVRLRAFTNVPTPSALDDWRENLSFGTDSLKHPIEIISQPHDCIKRHISMPLGAQKIDHFWEPYSLSITYGHVGPF